MQKRREGRCRKAAALQKKDEGDVKGTVLLVLSGWEEWEAYLQPIQSFGPLSYFSKLSFQNFQLLCWRKPDAHNLHNWGTHVS